MIMIVDHTRNYRGKALEQKAVVNAIMLADTYTTLYLAARTGIKCDSIEMKE
jgi:hypothetical protein